MSSRNSLGADLALILTRVKFVVLALFVAAELGCSDNTGPERFELQGQVTFDGKPVPAGRVQFFPDTSQGGKGPAGFAVIEEGKYDTRDEGRGTMGGPLRVLLDGFDGNADLDNELPHGQTLFSRPAQAAAPEADATIDFEIPKDTSEPIRTVVR